MGLWGIPDEYMLSFWLTIFGEIGVGMILAGILMHRILIERRQEEKMPLGLVYAGFVLMICVCLSRSLYFIGDFFLTHLIVEKYSYEPAIWVWKIASTIANVGLICLCIASEHVILLNKTRKLQTKTALKLEVVLLSGTIRKIFLRNSRAGARLSEAKKNPNKYLQF